MKFNEAATRLILSSIGNVTTNGMQNVLPDIIIYVCNGPVPTMAALKSSWATNNLAAEVNKVKIQELVAGVGGTVLAKGHMANVRKLPSGESPSSRVLDLSTFPEVNVIKSGTISYFVVGTSKDAVYISTAFVLSVGDLDSDADIKISTLSLELNTNFKFNDITLDVNVSSQ